MTLYVRVRVKDTKHEMDVPVVKAGRNPDKYTVIDPVPVGSPRAVKFYTGKKLAPVVPDVVETVDDRLTATTDVVVEDHRFSQA